jgi:hypothetical protein
MDSFAKLDLGDTPRLARGVDLGSLQTVREPAQNLAHNLLKSLNTGKEKAIITLTKVRRHVEWFPLGASYVRPFRFLSQKS